MYTSEAESALISSTRISLSEVSLVNFRTPVGYTSNKVLSLPWISPCWALHDSEIPIISRDHPFGHGCAHEACFVQFGGQQNA